MTAPRRLAYGWKLVLVGGEYDGQGSDLAWMLERCPPVLLVGRCWVDRDPCGGRAHPHTWFWIPGEAGRPHDATAYELERLDRQPCQGPGGERRDGRAVYVVSGVAPPPSQRLVAATR